MIVIPVLGAGDCQGKLAGQAKLNLGIGTAPDSVRDLASVNSDWGDIQYQPLFFKHMHTSTHMYPHTCKHECTHASTRHMGVGGYLRSLVAFYNDLQSHCSCCCFG